MKYDTLKSEIISILNGYSNDLTMKFYNDDGNNTFDPVSTSWCYVHDFDMLIEFPTETESTLFIWKSRENLSREMKRVFQKIRKNCVLNGVTVQIRIYGSLDQQEIYKVIKTSIEKRKNMKTESVSINSQIHKLFLNIINTSKTTNPNIDVYLSEDLTVKKKMATFNYLLNEFNNFKSLKPLRSVFKCLETISTFDKVQKLTNKLDESQKLLILENKQVINNICSFTKKATNSNNILPKITKNIMFMENVKVFYETVDFTRQNLVDAYNLVMNNVNGIKSDTDLLRVIRDEKVCENYGVQKRDLLNMFLYNGKPIENKTNIIIETYKGKQYTFSKKLLPGIKVMAEHINFGGTDIDKIAQKIISETVKYNHLSDLIETYKDNYHFRNHLVKFDDILKETILNLRDRELIIEKVTNENTEYDFSNYANYYNKLCKEIGFEHQAIKYLAEEKYLQNKIESEILNEQYEKDYQCLSNGLKSFTKNVDDVINHIMTHKISLKNNSPINESMIVTTKNIHSVAENIYKNLHESSDTLNPMITSIFNIVHDKKSSTLKNVKYLNTLKKYIIKV